jgi:hypothetical protein
MAPPGMCPAHRPPASFHYGLGAPVGLDRPTVGSARACWQGADLLSCLDCYEGNAMYIGIGTIVLIILIVLLILLLRRRV